MAMRNIHVPQEWIVVADAGPSYKNPARWGHFVAAYRIHRDSTANRPLAEGAAYVGGDTGINRAEYMAAIMGLRHVADRMWFGEWARDPVNIVTDNAYVYNQGVGAWNAGDLEWHLDRFNDVTALIADVTGEDVYFWHATHEENAGAHTLAAEFPKVCDRRNRDEWDLQRLLLRWTAVREHLHENGHVVCAASLAAAWVAAYNMKSLTLEFLPARAASRHRVEERKGELKGAVTAVMGQPLREIRCIET